MTTSFFAVDGQGILDHVEIRHDPALVVPEEAGAGPLPLLFLGEIDAH